MPFDLKAQIEHWRSHLLDTSKRNRLINFKTGRAGGIALVAPDRGELWHRLVAQGQRLTFAWQRDLIDLPPEAADSPSAVAQVEDPTEGPVAEPLPRRDLLERCRRSPRLRPHHLLTELPHPPLANRLPRPALNTREGLSEQGVAILYVAFGFLRWFEAPDSEVEIRSPLLLVPVRLERDNVEAPWGLQAEGEDLLANHSLAQLLADDFRLRLPLVNDEDLKPDDAAWRLGYFTE